MRIFVTLAFVLLAPVAWGQEKGIPDDFLAKMAKDLAGLTADPLPTTNMNFATHGFTASTGLIVPSKIQVEKNNTGVWSLDPATGKVVSKRVASGTEAPVWSQVQNYYSVQLDDGRQWWIQADDVRPVGPAKTLTQQQPDATWMSQQIEKLMKNASAFRDTYKSNQYVNVRGFSINIGVPPSVNVDFEFK